jgi:hypothetical protein
MPALTRDQVGRFRPQHHPGQRRRRLRQGRHSPGAAVLDPVRLFADGARRARHTIRTFIDDIAHAIFGVIAVVMKAAPIGAFGAMAYTIGKYGTGAIVNLLGLIAPSTHGGAVHLRRARAIARWPASRSSSSCATSRMNCCSCWAPRPPSRALPGLMEKLERLGCSKSVVGLVVPTGYSFNLDGTNIYMTLATLFIAQALGVDLTFAAADHDPDRRDADLEGRLGHHRRRASSRSARRWPPSIRGSCRAWRSCSASTSSCPNAAR